MRFKDIYGLKEIKTQLLKSVQKGRIAHGQLFYGAPGGLQLALALAYMTYLNCLNPTETDSCGLCKQCRLFIKFIHPDCHFFFPISKTPKVKSQKDLNSQFFMPQWRSSLLKNPYLDRLDWSTYIEAENKELHILREESKYIIKASSLKAYNAQYKIILIWLPETMNLFSANAILKLIEEPPLKTVFLLVSNDIESLLATIRSRLQTLIIPSLSDIDLVQQLKFTNPDLDSKDLETIVQNAGGNIGKALHLVDDHKHSHFQFFRIWMLDCLKKNYPALIKHTLTFSQLSRENQKQFFLYSSSIMAQVIYCGYSPFHFEKLPLPQKQFIEKFSKTIDYSCIEAFIAHIDKSMTYINRYANTKLLFFNLSIQCFNLFK